MARKPNVYQAARQHRRAVLAREEAAVDQLRAHWLRSRANMDRELTGLIKRLEAAKAAGKVAARGTTATTYSVSWLYRIGRLAEIMRTLEDELAEFETTGLEVTAAQGRILIATGVTHVQELLEFSTGSGIRAAQFSRPSSDAIQELNAMFSPRGPLPKAFATYSADTVEEVRRVIIAGVTQGKNPRVIAREVLGEAATNTDDKGLIETPFYKVARVTRTEPFRAYRESGRKTMQANDDVVGLWEWSCFAGPRTCAYCLAMDGRRFALGVRMATHPQCRCTQLPVTELSEPKEQTGAEYFHSLTAAEQDEILHSKAAGELYRLGVLTLDDFRYRYTHDDWGPCGRQQSLAGLVRSGKVTEKQVADALESTTEKPVWEYKRPPERQPVFNP